MLGVVVSGGRGDREWTTGIESKLLDREKVAEGKGFGPRERSPVFKTGA